MSAPSFPHIFLGEEMHETILVEYRTIVGDLQKKEEMFSHTVVIHTFFHNIYRMRCVLFFNMATSFFHNTKFAYIVRESVFVYLYALYGFECLHACE